MPVTSPPKVFKSKLPFVVLPVIMAVIYILQAGRTDAFTLLRYEIIAVFGYIAAVGDIKTKHIPNTLILAMLVVWVCVTAVYLLFDIHAAVSIIVSSVLGFAVSGTMFLIVYLLSRRGLGGGDVKFMASAGLYLGVSGSLTAIFIGTTLAALVGLVLLILKKIGRKDAFPLAPFLYAGILVAILF